MVRIVTWSLYLYLALKLSHVLFWPTPGFRRAPTDWRERLRSGEPYVLIVAVVLASSASLYCRWWVNRWATRDFEHSMTCLAQLEAGDRLPAFGTTFKASDVDQSTLGFYTSVKTQGAWLGLTRPAVDQTLASRTMAFRRRYAGLVAAGARTSIDEQFVVLDRCLKDEWPAHGEILHP